mmetsp:Transcript_58396/g.121263  ORF Transcript_58396/g.121263 Transcript_58396/m.121263 type:complete len:224 (-) Transcript_58396:63-734(-)|eukprot:s4945_g5.t1
MDVALLASDVDQLSQLLGECHLHEEREALAQVMMPIATYAGQLASGIQAPLPGSSVSAAAASGPWAEELMRRLQGCSSPEEGRETCAEMIAAFHQDQQQSSQRLLPARVPAHYAAAPMTSAAPAAAGYGPNAEFTARLQALQGANRVIVRALRILSARVREEGNRRRESEETVAQLKAELEAREEQLRASERAKALLQSRVAVLLQGQDAAGMPEASFSTPCI